MVAGLRHDKGAIAKKIVRLKLYAKSWPIVTGGRTPRPSRSARIACQFRRLSSIRATQLGDDLSHPASGDLDPPARIDHEIGATPLVGIRHLAP